MEHFVLTVCINGSLIDGQKIAQRLAKQISRETNRIKKHLQQYNAIESVLTCSSSQAIELKDVLSTQAEFWTMCTSTDSISTEPVPFSKQEIIHNYMYLLTKRAEEELAILADDMRNTIKYYNHQKMIVARKIEELTDELLHMSATTMSQIVLVRMCVCFETI